MPFKENRYMTKKKQNIRALSGALIVLIAIILSGCMQDLFNEELVKKTYEDAFPVKDIDPQMDWKMTRAVSVTVNVNDHNGSEYSILIYDNNPLIDDSNATLLAKSEATTQKQFSTVFDCPTYLDALYICKRDEAGRVVARLAEITNNSVRTTFGDNASTRALFDTRAASSLINPYTPAKSESEILNMASRAKELRSNTVIKAGEVWKISKDKTFRNDLNLQSSSQNPATIIIQGEWNPGGNIAAVQTGANVVVTSTGKIILPFGDAYNKSLNLNGNSTLTVYPDGYVGGEGGVKQGYIVMPTGSEGRVNYNAGTINVSTIDMRGDKSHFYNCGDLNIDQLIITNQGGKLTNMGQATIGETNYNGTIENGCFLKVTKDFYGSLLVDDHSSADLANYARGDQSWGKSIRMGSGSMLTIRGEAWMGGVTVDGISYPAQVQGPSRGQSLIRIEKLMRINGLYTNLGGNIFFEVNHVGVTNEWEKQTFLKQLMGADGTLARWGEAPVFIEAGECTGEGNTPSSSGKPTPEEPLGYTYVFEDNYPLVGDYDFNDVVIDVVPEYHREKGTNFIKRIQLDVTLTAAGASKAVGVGLRIVGIRKDQIASITTGGADRRFIESMKSEYSRFTFNEATHCEDSDPSVVIPIAGEVHHVFGTGLKLINTGEGETAKAYTYEIIIELADQKRTDPLFSKDNLDFFICYKYKNMQKRMEVHLYEFWKYGPTAAGTIQQLNLDLAGNNTWAVCVPYGFRYPKENINISRTDHPTECAYPDFIKWARDRNVCQDWYTRPNSGYVMRVNP